MSTPIASPIKLDESQRSTISDLDLTSEEDTSIITNSEDMEKMISYELNLHLNQLSLVKNLDWTSSVNMKDVMKALN